MYNHGILRLVYSHSLIAESPIESGRFVRCKDPFMSMMNEPTLGKGIRIMFRMIQGEVTKEGFPQLWIVSLFPCIRKHRPTCLFDELNQKVTDFHVLPVEIKHMF